MKLLHVLGNFKLPRDPEGGASGVIRAALEIARTQTRQGHEVTVVAVGPERWETAWQGVRLLQLQGTPWARVSLGSHTFDLSTHTPLIRLTQQEKFDVVQGHLYYYLRFLRAGARVSHFHADPLYGAGRALEAKRADFEVIAGCSDAQVAVSHFIARQIEKGMALSGAQPKVHTVHNGVLHKRFGTDGAAHGGAALRAAHGIPDEAVVFLFVGAVVPEKGLGHLVGAFERLAKRDARVQLLVAGSASLWDMAGQNAGRGYEADVVERLRPLVEAGKAHLLGAVKDSDMPCVYAACDVMVVPSVWPEPFGLVALEALAAGKPVIASDVGGLPETVGPDNGRLVAPGDDAALAAAMHAFTDPALRRAHGLTARASARHFSWDAAARKLERIYETALSVRA